MWEIKLWGVAAYTGVKGEKLYLISQGWETEERTRFSTNGAMLFDKRWQARKWCVEKMEKYNYPKRSFRVVRVVQRVEIVKE